MIIDIGTITNCINLDIELIIMMLAILNLNASGITTAMVMVVKNDAIGNPFSVLFENILGTCPWFDIDSRIRGVPNDAATLIPNIDTNAPPIIRFLMILFENTSARATTSLDVTNASGFIAIAIPTIPIYITAIIPIASGIALGRFFSGSSMSSDADATLSNPVNA